MRGKKRGDDSIFEDLEEVRGGNKIKAGGERGYA